MEKLLLVAVFAYGFLAMFVISNLVRNRRDERPNTAVLTLHGYGLMAGSLTMAGLLFAYSALLYLRG